MAYLQCPKCQADVTKKDVSCPQCGAPLTAQAGESWMPTISLEPQKPENRTWQYVLAAALGLGFLVFFFMNLPGKKVIYDGVTFEVSQGQAQALDVVLGQTVQLKESLRVLGGPSVDVMLMKEDQYRDYLTKVADAYEGGFSYEQALGGMGVSNLEENAKLSKGKYYLVVRQVRPLPNAPLPTPSQVKLTLTAEW